MTRAGSGGKELSADRTIELMRAALWCQNVRICVVCKTVRILWDWCSAKSSSSSRLFCTEFLHRTVCCVYGCSQVVFIQDEPHITLCVVGTQPIMDRILCKVMVLARCR